MSRRNPQQPVAAGCETPANSMRAIENENDCQQHVEFVGALTGISGRYSSVAGPRPSAYRTLVRQRLRVCGSCTL